MVQRSTLHASTWKVNSLLLTTELNCIGSWYWNVQGPSAVVSKPLDSTKGSMGGNINPCNQAYSYPGTYHTKTTSGKEDRDGGADKNSKGKIVTHRSSTERRLNYAMIDHSAKMEHVVPALISKNCSLPDQCYLYICC